MLDFRSPAQTVQKLEGKTEEFLSCCRVSETAFTICGPRRVLEHVSCEQCINCKVCDDSSPLLILPNFQVFLCLGRYQSGPVDLVLDCTGIVAITCSSNLSPQTKFGLSHALLLTSGINYLKIPNGYPPIMDLRET